MTDDSSKKPSLQRSKHPQLSPISPTHKNICGERLRLTRIRLHLSQAEVVQQLEKTQNLKMSTATLSRIENQKRELYDFELVAFVKVLRVSVEWLFYGDPKSP